MGQVGRLTRHGEVLSFTTNPEARLTVESVRIECLELTHHPLCTALGARHANAVGARIMCFILQEGDHGQGKNLL